MKDFYCIARLLLVVLYLALLNFISSFISFFSFITRFLVKEHQFTKEKILKIKSARLNAVERGIYTDTVVLEHQISDKKFCHSIGKNATQPVGSLMETR